MVGGRDSSSVNEAGYVPALCSKVPPGLNFAAAGKCLGSEGLSYRAAARGWTW